MLHPLRLYRLARWLHLKHVPVLPKLIGYANRLIFGCWLPHTVQLGKGCVLGYQGMSIVLHSDLVAGDNVHIDQCVTIGGNGTEPGVPRIGSNVYIGCGAKILGPLTVGSGVVIGANSVVLKDIPDNTVVAGVPARVIKENIDITEFLCHLRNKKRREQANQR